MVEFPPRELRIDAARVEEYVTALGVEPEPGYRAEVGALLPPGFLMYVTTYGADSVHGALGLDPARILYAGSRVEHYRPVRVGDTVTVAPAVAKPTTKQGSRGTLTFYEIACDYLLQDGSLAARERSTVVDRSAS